MHQLFLVKRVVTGDHVSRSRLSQPALPVQALPSPRRGEGKGNEHPSQIRRGAAVPLNLRAGPPAWLNARRSTTERMPILIDDEAGYHFPRCFSGRHEDSNTLWPASSVATPGKAIHRLPAPELRRIRRRTAAG